MGKHDQKAHQLHISKRQKFNAPQPSTAPLDRQQHAPQEPKQGTTAQNQYK